MTDYNNVRIYDVVTSDMTGERYIYIHFVEDEEEPVMANFKNLKNVKWLSDGSVTFSWGSGKKNVAKKNAATEAFMLQYFAWRIDNAPEDAKNEFVKKCMMDLLKKGTTAEQNASSILDIGESTFPDICAMFHNKKDEKTEK